MSVRARGPARIIATAFLTGFAAWGCSSPGDEQPHPGACPPFFLLSSSPFPGETGVALSTDVDLRFSDYPDPDSFDVSTLVVTSGFFRNPGSYRVDLLSRTLIFRGTYFYAPNINHAITIEPTVRSVQGCTLGRREQRTFHTGVDAPPRRPGPRAVAFEEVADIFRRSCWRGCHGAAPAEDRPCRLEAPAGGLSLCDEDAHAELVNIPSRQVNRFRRVEPHDSSRSYLLFKLLDGREPGTVFPLVQGHRDPPLSADGMNGPLPDEELRTISDWIDRGAPPARPVTDNPSVVDKVQTVRSPGPERR